MEVIIALVKQNPWIMHTELRDLIRNDLGIMSGRTFDSLIVSMRNSGFLLYKKRKNRLYYKVPKTVDPKDIAFLRAVQGELFHVRKVMIKAMPVFANQRNSQMAQILTFAGFLNDIWTAYIAIKPFYDSPQTDKIEKYHKSLSLMLQKMIKRMDQSHVHMVSGQFFGYASGKRLELDKRYND